MKWRILCVVYSQMVLSAKNHKTHPKRDKIHQKKSMHGESGERQKEGPCQMCGKHLKQTKRDVQCNTTKCLNAIRMTDHYRSFQSTSTWFPHRKCFCRNLADDVIGFNATELHSRIDLITFMLVGRSDFITVKWPQQTTD